MSLLSAADPPQLEAMGGPGKANLPDRVITAEVRATCRRAGACCVRTIAQISFQSERCEFSLKSFAALHGAAASAAVDVNESFWSESHADAYSGLSRVTGAHQD